MGSSRLPGKSLRPILGKPMLAYQIERLQRSMLLDRIIVATSVHPRDDAIAELAHTLGIECFRGSEDDVLGRVAGALRQFDVEIHAEFQGDNPMPDPMLVDSVIGYYLKNADRYDYVTNGLRTTYPPGAEVTVYPARILLEAERSAVDPAAREHVGPHIYDRPDRYRIFNLEAPPWLRAPDVHLEVDTEEDFEVVSRVFEHFCPANPGFTMMQAVEFARSEGLDEINKNVHRRWQEFRRD